jgi:hypothetical protein
LLGLHNDFVSTKNMLKQLNLSQSSAAEKGAEFVLGWSAHEDHSNMKKIAKSWKKLTRTETFWE